ncbi:125R [Cherax quadricarinatus iridovirus]|uniref:DNA repair RAD2 n=1 Tax=Shrimp hemocyte iridescent virus TaxID=2039780 RepID=A0A291B0M6_9VIRU|nr:125R [Cherax quadricarinatus iridovirus]YP_010084783.1 DNA repair RAD2 [Shrimp hemocyte iridescent virus]UPA43432.1 DNA repair RAD2 [Iridovirus CN01]ASZ85105.1 125R [Cherax quadricarinatus iridovirus]ATE87040.1 DNA repair RAD2 [Shrimp hemocyte iridescent virus]UPA43508.1 DNA repair RAD2 [Iridovirus CN01]UPA43704.1 DNA repair RAD2 [Iridovirus CN01]
MGIKGLRAFLKSKIENFETVIEKNVSFNEYTNETIAIDTSLFIWVYKATQKQALEEAIMNFISALMSRNINPLFVFDGTSPPEKSDEKKKRNQKSQDLVNRVNALKKGFEIYSQTGILSDLLKETYETKIVADTKTKIVLKGRVKSETKSVESKPPSVKTIDSYIKKLENGIVNVTSEDFDTLRNVLNLFGIPSITAEGEAEILCVELVKQNYAKAVFTKDTDVLAAGVPVMINNIDFRRGEFCEIKLEDILRELGLTESSWLDFCIMCGTDFNNNIPRVGPVKSYGFIKKHESIEAIGNNEAKLDISILNHERIRSLFKCDNIPEEIETITWSPPNLPQIKDRIETNNLKISYLNLEKKLSM